MDACVRTETETATATATSIDASASAAERHAQNKRVIKTLIAELLRRSGTLNAGWLAWFQALRPCADGKSDDIADALAQAYYHLRDKLVAGAKAHERALKAYERTLKAHAKPHAKPSPSASASAGAGASADAGAESEPEPAPTELWASSCDVGFKNLAYAVVRVFADASVAADPLLLGLNFEVLRWERVDCLALAGVPGVNVNGTNMHRLTEILMCGVARHAESLFGTMRADIAHGGLDFFLLETQKASGAGPGGAHDGTNIKTHAASHILQACCMLHHALRGSRKCPLVEFVSSSKKTQDVAKLAALVLAPASSKAKAVPRAKVGLAAQIKPVHALCPESNSSAAGVGAGAGASAGASAGDGAGAGASAGAGAGAGIGGLVVAAGVAAAVEAVEAWRAPFQIGAEGLKWRSNMNPDAKKRAAEDARKRKRVEASAAAAIACSDNF